MNTEDLAEIVNAEKPKNTFGLKLNIPRTILVGLAFFTITMFWQVYDSIMPLFLRDLMGDIKYYNFWSGIIMALDNILALILMPFMGLFSDRFPMKLRNKIGRRMPFIVVGSIMSAFLFLIVNFAHNQRMLLLMIVVTVFLLVFMCLYRTPAVALMPDVTPKPIRSQGNTVINIMGTIGGVISLILMNVLLKTQEVQIENSEETFKILSPGANNWILISIIAGLMILSTFIMILKVKENKFCEEKKAQLEALGINEDENDEVPQDKQSTKQVLAGLSKKQKLSLLFLLLSVSFWYFAYNAVTTWFSRFSYEVLDDDFTLPLLIANAAAFVMFVPASFIGKKIGRKNTILIGVGLMIFAFILASIALFFTPNILKIIMYPVFILVGAGWATINVHSFVMSVEFANENTTGVFTGLYYFFSMFAQIMTPVLSGLLSEVASSFKILMPYALFFCCLAFITMLFVKHGNAKPIDLSAASVGDK